jgi:hypothetical protein
VTKVGWDEDGNRAEGKSKDRGRDRERDEGGGKDIEVQSIYSSKMNKYLYKEKRKGNRIVGGQVPLYTHLLLPC